MAEETKKEGFFKKVLKSVKDFDKYEDFALEKPIDGIKYLLKLVLIFAAIIGIVYTYRITTNINRLYTGMKEQIPEFSYENGSLTTKPEEPVVIEDYGETIGTIIIDTKVEQDKIEEEYQKEIDKYGSAIIFTKNRIIVTNPNMEGQVSYNYSELLDIYHISNFNKQEIVEKIAGINIVSITISIYIMIFVYLFVLYFISIAIDILILSLLAYIVGRMTGMKLKVAPAFNVAAHSITLPVILNMIYIIINVVTGFEIKYFQIMYNVISYIYVVVAILMIKTDFIGRQMELMKLAKEQEKIKKEMEEQAKREKDKETEKPKEEKKDKKQEEDNKEADEPIKSAKKQRKKKSSKEETEGTDPVGDASIVSEEK